MLIESWLRTMRLKHKEYNKIKLKENQKIVVV